MEDDLRTKTFNRIIDKYLQTGHMTAEDYEGCTDRQKDTIQVIKRAFKRMGYGRETN